MPANLTPEYLAAETEFKAARSSQEKLLCLERMLSTIPKHKGTEKMQADIKRRIARLRDSLEKTASKKGFAIRVEPEGAAQTALVGAPNAGKSSLLEAATNARAEVGDHPFATRRPAPGMLSFENVQFQLVDLPPVSRQHLDYWVIDIVRGADSALWVIDASDPGFEVKAAEVEEVLGARKIRLVSPKADVARSGNVRELRALLVATKVDEETSHETLPRIRERFDSRFPILELSALADNDFTRLGRALFDLNNLIRVFPKVPGKDADLSAPFVLHKGDRVLDFARLVHKDFAANLRYARLWGHGRFEGQRVHRDEELLDGDVIELHM
jgi:ribosome-interacting GTPase 1